MSPDIDYMALFEFRFALHRFLRFSEEEAVAEGLSPQTHQLLLAIRGRSVSGWLSVSDIAEALLLKHHSTVELVERAAAKRLVCKTQHPQDRRFIEVSLTPLGFEILERLSQRHIEEIGVLAKLIPSLFDTQP